jgi:hypothetical protein
MSADLVGRPVIWDAQVEQLDEAKCLRLISGGGVGRIAYSSRMATRTWSSRSAFLSSHYDVAGAMGGVLQRP